MPEPIWPKGLWEWLSLYLLPGCFNPTENEAQDLSYVCAVIQHFRKGRIQSGTISGNVVSAELKFSLSQDRLDGDHPHLNKALELFVNVI